MCAYIPCFRVYSHVGYYRVSSRVPYATWQVLIVIYFMYHEEAMATHSRILAWRIPWTEEPGGLHSMGSQRVKHN